MGIFDFPRSNDLDKKVLDVKDDVKSLILKTYNEKFDVSLYGAYNIDPRHLVYLIIAPTDNKKIKLMSDKDLLLKLRALLSEHDYPLNAVDDVLFCFESQETVDRESNGDWYHHLK